jgi:transposase
MTRYIGMDVHATSTTVAVVGPSGRQIACQVVETNGKVLVDLMHTIPTPRHVCLEEGTHSGWLYEILAPHVDQIVVMAQSEKRGAKRSKSDQIDAFELANKLRTNSVKTPVYKQLGPYGRLRELCRVYTLQTRDLVRVQNRIKALFRSRALSTPGSAIYQPEQREKWVEKLPIKCRHAALLLLKQYDELEKIRAESQKLMLQESRQHPAVKLLATVPGIGPIRSAQLVRIIISPHRFRSRSQLWKYAGFAVVTHGSAEWIKDRKGQLIHYSVQKTRGLNRDHNTVLKDIFKGAATTVIIDADPTCPLYRHYTAMIANKIKPNLAKLTLARQIAAITLAIWKKEEIYKPDKVNSTP